jgi:hypothetical protein
LKLQASIATQSQILFKIDIIVKQAPPLIAYIASTMPIASLVIIALIASTVLIASLVIIALTASTMLVASLVIIALIASTMLVASLILIAPIASIIPKQLSLDRLEVLI